MKCQKYTGKDFEAIRSWYEARHLKVLEEDFPKIGIIVPGIAAGFLMQTDTMACILEPFIANPDTNKLDRDQALNLIMGELIEEAGDLGYTRIFGFSSNTPMLRRARKWGFIEVESSTTVVKELP